MEAQAENSRKSDIPDATVFTMSWREAERKFLRPLTTAHGIWTVRKTIILRLDTGDGRHGYGEIAPVAEFDTPEIPECAELLRNIGRKVERGSILSADLPGVVHFAFGSAIAMLDGRLPKNGHWPLSRLLPRGPDALFAASRRICQGSRCFKYKMLGVPDDPERELLAILFDTLKAAGGKLRVDFNESLPPRRAEKLLRWLAETGGPALDFVEQPLKRGKEDEMRIMAGRTGVPIALDESVAALEDLQRFADWAGPIVIKPALTGDPDKTAAILSRREGRTVFSSAFESPVGLWGCMLAVGSRVPEPLGFGTGVWPDGDLWGHYTEGVSIDPGRITLSDLDALWIGLFR